MDLICPKCQGQLRQYERSGVTVDQCTECRGIFLDRGELDKLIDAEADWQKQQAAPPAPAPQPQYAQHAPAPQPQYAQPQYREPHYQQQSYHGKPYKKKKHFFEELFD